MTPAISTRVTSSAIITALIAAVTAVKLADNATAAFDRVDFFDVDKLAEAFRYLIVTEQRVCVIVPLEEKFNTKLTGTIVTITRCLPVALLISDRILGDTNRKFALLGNDTTPGAQGLVDLTLPAVTGMLIPPASPVSGVKCLPTSSCVLPISSTDKGKLSSRVCVVLELECTGGYLQANVGPGVTL